MLDGARAARRDRRRADAAARAAKARVAREIGERHADERARLWARHPDVAGFVARDREIWRPGPGRDESIVVGAGAESSSTRVIGGGDDRESAELRARAARLEHAPVVVPASVGVAVVGDAVLAGAVLRALVMQLCMMLPPGDLRIVGSLRGENAWAERLPHRRAVTGRTLCLVGAGESAPGDADITIVHADSVTPPGCAVVLAVRSPTRSSVDFGGEVREIEVEAIGVDQAAHLADELAARATRVHGLDDTAMPVALGPLLVEPVAPARGTLPAVIGIEAGDPFVVDLVADGPHAVVGGVTGSGKSELLVTWIIALSAAHSTRQVSFLLADFKGGTAFDVLADVPHVTGVITDLDGAGARRAIDSLRAEVRWREAELARAGARDILDPRVDLPRLVIVVDEFAALLGEHPELHAVFTDVAARGRALGMHLILGTQRPAGVVRESLLSNCPLRISLRMTDPADSRAILGTDEAAALPGGYSGRGLALVRTAGDPSPRRVRIALSSLSDSQAIGGADSGPRPRRPWLPELPGRIELADLTAVADDSGDTLLIGLVDEPERQHQQPGGVRLSQRGLLVVGGAGSGKTTALRTMAAQVPAGVMWIPTTAEDGWDAVADLVERAPAPGTLVVLDDVDVLIAALPAEYARELVERLERLVRGAGAAEMFVVASAQRIGAAVARLADLLPRRLVLATASRSEHIAAGGEPAHYAPALPPGRGRLDGRAIQVAVSRSHGAPSPAAAEPWQPHRPLTGLVMRRSPVTRDALATWTERGARVFPLDEFAGTDEWAGPEPVVVAGDVEEWQRHWRVLSMVRSDHDLVVDAACAAELRMLTGERGIPPYCEPGLPRGWLISSGGAPARIVLPRGAESRRP